MHEVKVSRYTSLFSKLTHETKKREELAAHADTLKNLQKEYYFCIVLRC